MPPRAGKIEAHAAYGSTVCTLTIHGAYWDTEKYNPSNFWQDNVKFVYNSRRFPWIDIRINHSKRDQNAAVNGRPASGE
eukprot:COSAG02_NODE_2213_length_9490_cov_2.784155_12_plen_79_part_00